MGKQDKKRPVREILKSLCREGNCRGKCGTCNYVIDYERELSLAYAEKFSQELEGAKIMLGREDLHTGELMIYNQAISDCQERIKGGK